MKIYAKNLEQNVINQFTDCLKDSSCIDWALMPDAHLGYTLPIGWVILNKEKIFPAYVGYDIGCGMCAVRTNIYKNQIKWKEQEIFDKIYKEIPCWAWEKWISKEEITNMPLTDFWKTIWESNRNQIWTLWGWNHFIEIWYDELWTIWIIIHSWSRWFGYKIADHYMKLAKKTSINLKTFEKEFEEKNINVKKYNPEKYGELLQIAIDKYIKKETKWECGGNNWFNITSENWKDYIMDMEFSLEFALLNRTVMIDKVLNILWAKKEQFINKNHNCADFLENWVVRHRKWATSAWKWEYWVIPGNMKDWTAIIIWKWNKNFLECSSHWAWRVLSRKQAQKEINVKDFKKDMEWIVAKVGESTKDESRFAYKDFNEVLDLQKDSISVINRIKPIINIKW